MNPIQPNMQPLRPLDPSRRADRHYMNAFYNNRAEREHYLSEAAALTLQKQSEQSQREEKKARELKKMRRQSRLAQQGLLDKPGRGKKSAFQTPHPGFPAALSEEQRLSRERDVRRARDKAIALDQIKPGIGTGNGAGPAPATGNGESYFARKSREAREQAEKRKVDEKTLKESRRKEEEKRWEKRWVEVGVGLDLAMAEMEKGVGGLGGSSHSNGLLPRGHPDQYTPLPLGYGSSNINAASPPIPQIYTPPLQNVQHKAPQQARNRPSLGNPSHPRNSHPHPSNPSRSTHGSDFRTVHTARTRNMTQASGFIGRSTGTHTRFDDDE